MALQLKLVTPQATVFEGTVDECNAPGAEGLFGVLPEHISYLTAVVPGPLRFVQGGSKQSFAIGRGFIQVADDAITVLTRFADEAASIDGNAAESELAEAEKAFTEVGPSDQGYTAAEDRVLEARARMNALAE